MYPRPKKIECKEHDFTYKETIAVADFIVSKTEDNYVKNSVRLNDRLFAIYVCNSCGDVLKEEIK